MMMRMAMMMVTRMMICDVDKDVVDYDDDNGDDDT